MQFSQRFRSLAPQFFSSRSKFKYCNYQDSLNWQNIVVCQRCQNTYCKNYLRPFCFLGLDSEPTWLGFWNIEVWHIQRHKILTMFNRKTAWSGSGTDQGVNHKFYHSIMWYLQTFDWIQFKTTSSAKGINTIISWLLAIFHLALELFQCLGRRIEKLTHMCHGISK